MVEEILLELLTERVLISSYKRVKDLISNKKQTLKSSLKEIEKSLIDHFVYVNNWSKDVSFRELDKAKKTLNIYIQLNFYLRRRRRSIQTPQVANFNFSEILKESSSHLVILGSPGAGKTTSMKFLSQSILNKSENFESNKINCPIIIRLRDLDNEPISKNVKEAIFDRLYKILGINVEIDKESFNKKNDYEWFKKQIIIDFLSELNVLLILDGFDEITNKYLKEKVLKEIEELALKLQFNSRLVITCRTGGFPYEIEGTETYELVPLNENQIKLFAHKWIGDKNQSDQFLIQIKESPYYDTTIRPLTLAHLCSIFVQDGSIPNKPKTVYRLIVQLLLKEWNIQRRIFRKSQYGNFEVDRKFEFLASLAFVLTTKIKLFSFSRRVLSECYTKICKDFKLPKNEVDYVVDELESYNGLFLRTGFDSYEFAHKSIQEYLTAEYIVKLPYFLSDTRLLLELPNELAICVAISTDPTAFLSILLFDKLKNEREVDLIFIESFISRLNLEKPDFSISSVLAIVILNLFTQHVRTRQAVISANHIREIGKLMKEKMIIESLKEIKKFYRTFDKVDKLYGIELKTTIYKIRKINFPSVNSVSIKKIPEVLFVPESIYKLIEF